MPTIFYVAAYVTGGIAVSVGLALGAARADRPEGIAALLTFTGVMLLTSVTTCQLTERNRP